ncbi:MAG TPA: lipoprotein [Burkholderiales bacterium]|nr:lipoprotein [Burkholderiales bacterium]
MRALLTLLAIAVVFSGCGYKTPLKLPPPKPAEKAVAQKPPPEENDKTRASEPWP